MSAKKENTPTPRQTRKNVNYRWYIEKHLSCKKTLQVSHFRWFSLNTACTEGDDYHQLQSNVVGLTATVHPSFFFLEQQDLVEVVVHEQSNMSVQ